LLTGESVSPIRMSRAINCSATSTGSAAKLVRAAASSTRAAAASAGAAAALCAKRNANLHR
jgi:hypothetical protein